jgi:hypothetical protein
MCHQVYAPSLPHHGLAHQNQNVTKITIDSANVTHLQGYLTRHHHVMVFHRVSYTMMAAVVTRALRRIQTANKMLLMSNTATAIVMMMMMMMMMTTTKTTMRATTTG